MAESRAVAGKCVHCSKVLAADIAHDFLCVGCEDMLYRATTRLVSAAKEVKRQENVVRDAVEASRRFISGHVIFCTAQPVNGTYADKALHVAQKRESAEVALDAAYGKLAIYEDLVWEIEDEIAAAKKTTNKKRR